MEATCHASELVHAYAEISRVLKPDAPFGLSEWVLTTTFDAINPHHTGVRNRIERGNGIANMQPVTVARSALRAAGFAVTYEEDFASHWERNLRFAGERHDDSGRGDGEGGFHPVSSVVVPYRDGARCAPPPVRPCELDPRRGSARPRPWWFPTQGDMSGASGTADRWIIFKMKPGVRRVGFAVLFVLEKVLRVYPRGACEAMNTMEMLVDSTVQGGREGIFSPCWWFVCRKVGEPGMDIKISEHH